MTSTASKKGKQAPKTSRGGLIAGIVGGAVVLLLILAVVGPWSNTSPGSEYGDPTVEGGLPLMPPSATIDDSAAGLAAPTVSGEDFDGNEVRIENDGRAKAIVFLAHWCPHCQAEVPRVQAWLDETGGVEGVDMYSVATSMNSGRDNFPSSDWLEREGWTVPVIRDDQANSILVAYGQGGFPFWAFVARDGTVSVRTAGQTSIEQLQLILETLAAE